MQLNSTLWLATVVPYLFLFVFCLVYQDWQECISNREFGVIFVWVVVELVWLGGFYFGKNDKNDAALLAGMFIALMNYIAMYRYTFDCTGKAPTFEYLAQDLMGAHAMVVYTGGIMAFHFDDLPWIRNE